MVVNESNMFKQKSLFKIEYARPCWQLFLEAQFVWLQVSVQASSLQPMNFHAEKYILYIAERQ